MATSPLADGLIHKGQIWRTKGYGTIHTIKVRDAGALTWSYTNRPWEVHITPRSKWHDEWVLYFDIDTSGHPTTDAEHGTMKARECYTARSASFTFNSWGLVNDAFDKGMKPSEILEDVRMELVRLRSLLSALGDVLPIWDERLEPVEGGLTLCLIALHAKVQESKQNEGEPQP